MDSFKCLDNLDGLHDMEDTDEWAQPLTLINNDHFHQEHNRSIIHLDIDCFYAQVEMLFNPDLRNKPLGIQQKNIIITTNYLARQLGVPKSTYVADAVKKWPQLVLVNGEDLTKYRQKSYEISEFLQKYSPKVERLGFDENFIDVSELVSWRLRDKSYKDEFIGYLHQSSISQSSCDCGCHQRLQIASQIAMDIREALKKELSITSSAGIAHNKLLAKLIGATHKPNQQTTILPPQAIEFMSSFSSVRCIPGIGLSTGNTLQRMGILSVVDLQKADRAILEKDFGSSAAGFLINSSLGIDDSPVIKFEQPHSMSDEDSFQCCNTMEDAECRIKGLIQSLLKRVSEDGRTPQTIRLTVRRISAGAQTWEKYRKRESRQCPVPSTVFTALQRSVDDACELLMPILINLFTKLVDISKPFHLTLINIGFTNLLKPTEKKIKKISSYFLKALKEDIVDEKNNNKPINQTRLSKGFKERRNLCNKNITIHPLLQVSQNQALIENSLSDNVSNNKNLSDEMSTTLVTELLYNDSNETSGLSAEERLHQLKCSNATEDSNSDRHEAPESHISSLKRPAETEVGQNAKCRKNSCSLEESCDAMLKLDSERNDRISEQYQKEEEALLKLAIEMSKQTYSTCSKDQIIYSDQGVEITKTSPHKQPFDKKLNNLCSQSNAKIKSTRKLPAGIDPSVFSELPKNIQSEILAHVAMASSPKPSLKKSIHVQNTKSPKHKEKEQSKETSCILKYFSRNT